MFSQFITDRSLRPLAMMMIAIVLSEREAAAYTDPGSSALLWQMLAAGFVACGFYFRRVFAWAKGLVKPESRKN